MSCAGLPDELGAVRLSRREKSVVEGSVSAQTEGSRRRLDSTVWIIDRASEAPRLVTAYPGKE